MFFYSLLLQLPTNPSDYQWIPSLGIGGILAGGMFLAYRQDRKASEARLSESAEASEARLSEVTKNFMTIVKDNTTAMTSLVTIISERERR